MSAWTQISNLISGIAPTIANAILPGSGTAVTMLSNALTGKPNSTPDEILSAAQQADAKEKIEALELNFQLEMSKMDHEADALAITAPYADTASARQREVDLAKAAKADNTPRILALIFISAYIIFAFLSMFYPKVEIEGIRSDMTNIAILIIGYYFGSSSSSRNKDEIISNQAKNSTLK